jgi:isopentenyl diphosphate isomerase/L-lactate dehydrogenase-like FMN-dependent dehydrogenase
VDPSDFVDARVLIIGKGNSAFETADNLIETAAVIHVAGPSSIRMAWRSHFVGHLRAVNNGLLDTYQLKSQNALLDGTIRRIEHRDGHYVVSISFARANEVTKDLSYDRVIACTGFRFDPSIFAAGCEPELVIDDRFPAQTPEWESTNVSDLYFAGTLMQARDYKRSTTGFIHGFRYGVRALHRILERKHHGADWPHRVLPVDPEALTEAVIARVNRTSALWQQFEVMCDLIVVGLDGRARYYEELPVDYVLSGDLGAAECCFTITLEYGPGHDLVDPFDISVGRIAQDDAERSHEGRYLHPVVRQHSRGTLVAEHHVAENLENEWTGPAHREPLRAFFARAVAGEVIGDVALARGRLDPRAYDFFAGGADDEVTLRANEAGLARLALVPRVLRGAPEPRLEMVLLGTSAALPVLVAPTAFHRLAHPDGERATARAAAAAGAIMIVSMASTVAIEEIAAAAPDASLWFQLFVQPDLGFTEAIVRRAEAAGCGALVVTVDSPVFGHRERDLRNGFDDLPPGMCCENLRDARDGDRPRPIAFTPPTWEHVDWLRERTALPIVLKGVMHPEDARLALERGVDALVVSNHGGRQLDAVPAAVDLLAPIADVVGASIPLVLDGGIRRGTDAVKACALGASAVAIGRPVLWGLAAAGEAGVAAVLALLGDELRRALALCGSSSVSDLRRDLVRRVEAA